MVKYHAMVQGGSGDPITITLKVKAMKTLTQLTVHDSGTFSLYNIMVIMGVS